MVPEKGGTLSILWAFLNWDMLVWLLGAGLFLLAIAHVMWFFERKSQPYFRVPYREGLWPSFWYSLHAVITGGFEENSPHTVPGRILGVFLVIASLFVGAAFVAKITSVLTVAELQSQIRSHKDLYGRKVGTTAGSTAAAFLRNNAIQHVTVDSVDELFNAVATKKIEAAVHDAPLLAYFAATEGRGRVRVVGPILRPEKFGIALREGSPLKEQINRTLLRMNEDGTYRRILNKWFGER
jgi:polar amino acid transport system substrate-binding protein